MFKTINGHNVDRNIYFYPLGELLTRLMVKLQAKSKKIKLINVVFCDTELFKSYISKPSSSFILIDKVLSCYINLDLYKEEKINTKTIWDLFCVSINRSLTTLDENILSEQVILAQKIGVSSNLNLDYTYMSKQFKINEHEYEIKINVVYKEEQVCFVLFLLKNNIIYLINNIYCANRNHGIYIHIFKDIILNKKNEIILTGKNNIINLIFPIKISIVS